LQSQRFSDIFERAHEWQEIRLAEGGLRGEFNSCFCKFIMYNACGFSEKAETKITAENPDPIAEMIRNAMGKSADMMETINFL
jgi:hypothetical protein